MFSEARNRKISVCQIWANILQRPPMKLNLRMTYEIKEIEFTDCLPG